MKTRIISGAVGAILLIITLIFRATIMLDIVIGLIALIATYEILNTTKTGSQIPFMVVSMVFTVLSVFSVRSEFGITYNVLAIIYSILFCCYVLYTFEKVRMTVLFTAYTLIMFISFAFSSLIAIIDHPHGMFYFILIAFSAWGSDTGAYFVGCAIGKHKLAPVLSPKKTVEGLVGGIVSNLVLSILFALIYSLSVESVESVSYLLVILVAVLGSLVSVVGDLFASAIKRYYKIKDYGNIMPGHGGVLDRFDSMLMVTAYMVMIMQVFTLVR